MTRYFIAGNVWLLVALVLLLGKNVMRGSPTRYAFFGIGGWYAPGTYYLIVLICAVIGAAFLIAARPNRGTQG